MSVSPWQATNVEGAYPGVRAALRPDLADLSDEEVEQTVTWALGPSVSAAELEEFFPAILGGIAKLAGPVLSGVLPSVAKGIGGLLGGGGAAGGGSIVSKLLGGLVPSIGGLLGGGGAPTPPQVPRPVPPAAVQLPAGGSPAAGQLLSLVTQPQFLQALMSLLMGQAGRPMIPVGQAGTPVPAPAFAGLVQTLAGRVLGDYAAGNVIPGEAAYLMSESGEFIVDPADPQQRADVLLELLRSASEAEAASFAAMDVESDEAEAAGDDYYYGVASESEELLLDVFADDVWINS